MIVGGDILRIRISFLSAYNNLDPKFIQVSIYIVLKSCIDLIDLITYPLYTYITSTFFNLSMFYLM